MNAPCNWADLLQDSWFQFMCCKQTLSRSYLSAGRFSRCLDVGGHPPAHWQLPIILLSSVVEDVSCTSVVSRDETIRISRAEGCGQPGEAKIVIVTYRLYVTIYRFHVSTSLARSSAIAEGPRDASCQLKYCQLPRNSAETTCTTKSWTKYQLSLIDPCNKIVL